MLGRRCHIAEWRKLTPDARRTLFLLPSFQKKKDFISNIDLKKNVKATLVSLKIWTLNFSSLPTLTSIRTSVYRAIQYYTLQRNCKYTQMCIKSSMLSTFDEKNSSKRPVGF